MVHRRNRTLRITLETNPQQGAENFASISSSSSIFTYRSVTYGTEPSTCYREEVGDRHWDISRVSSTPACRDWNQDTSTFFDTTSSWNNNIRDAHNAFDLIRLKHNLELLLIGHIHTQRQKVSFIHFPSRSSLSHRILLFLRHLPIQTPGHLHAVFY